MPIASPKRKNPLLGISRQGISPQSHRGVNTLKGLEDTSGAYSSGGECRLSPLLAASSGAGLLEIAHRRLRATGASANGIADIPHLLPIEGEKRLVTPADLGAFAWQIVADKGPPEAILSRVGVRAVDKAAVEKEHVAGRELHRNFLQTIRHLHKLR